MGVLKSLIDEYRGERTHEHVEHRAQRTCSVYMLSFVQASPI